MRRAGLSESRNFSANVRWGLSWTLRFFALTVVVISAFEVFAPGEISARFGVSLPFVVGVYGSVALVAGFGLGIVRSRLAHLGWSCFVGFAIAWLLLAPFVYTQYVRKGRENGLAIFSLATVVAAMLGVGAVLQQRWTNESHRSKREK